jgi:hypothetical protein
MRFRALVYILAGVSLLLGSNKVGHGQEKDTFTLVSYNILKYPGSTYERWDTFQTIMRYEQPDLIMVNELKSASGADTLLDSALVPIKPYKRAKFYDGPYSDNMLFYDSTLFTLYGQYQIPTDLRDISRYIVYLNDPNLSSHNDTTFLDLFSVHLKAGNSSSDENKRAAEADTLMNHLDSLPADRNIVVGGDYNFYNASEPAWDTLMGPNVNPLNDPLDSAGDWHENSKFEGLHTQSTRTSGCDGTGPGATGGLDDRFDFNLIDDDVLNGTQRITYLPGTYWAMGNDGNHLNECITSAPNDTLPDSVLVALQNMSDHLPVRTEFEVEYPSTLPISALHFQLQERSGNVHLRWRATEVGQTKYFEIQRRTERSSFQTIHRLQVGSSDFKNHFQFEDIDVQPHQAYYYRIRQIQEHNRHASPTKHITLSSRNTLQLEVLKYTQNTVTLQVGAPRSRRYQLSLIDMTGRLLLNKSVNLEPGKQKLDLALPPLSSALYIWKVNGPTGVAHQQWNYLR